MANEQIVLGCGDFYVMALPASGVVPTDSTIEVEDNLIGYTEGGASLAYKPTELQIEDDNHVFLRRFVTKEEVTMKTGVLTWNLETLNKLAAISTYTDDTTTGVRTMKLGGKGAREMVKWVVHFVHTKDDGKKIRVTIVGTASSGFDLAFASDKETVVDAEFKAINQDSNGTQVIVTEEYDVPTPPNLIGDNEDEE